MSDLDELMLCNGREQIIMLWSQQRCSCCFNRQLLIIWEQLMILCKQGLECVVCMCMWHVGVWYFYDMVSLWNAHPFILLPLLVYDSRWRSDMTTAWHDKLWSVSNVTDCIWCEKIKMKWKDSECGCKGEQWVERDYGSVFKLPVSYF